MLVEGKESETEEKAEGSAAGDQNYHWVPMIKYIYHSEESGYAYSIVRQYLTITARQNH